MLLPSLPACLPACFPWLPPLTRLCLPLAPGAHLPLGTPLLARFSLPGREGLTLRGLEFGG